MLPNEKFKFEQTIKGDRKVIALKGVIDEDTNFDALSQLSGAVTFNFKGVTSINSLGIRSWVNLLKELASAEVSYEACPPLIVRQMNMVPSFLGKGKVLSVFVPYICESCETEALALAEAAQFSNLAKKFPCESCKKGEMEFDGHPEQYFAFLK
jgi:hypothetical protein